MYKYGIIKGYRKLILTIKINFFIHLMKIFLLEYHWMVFTYMLLWKFISNSKKKFKIFIYFIAIFEHKINIIICKYLFKIIT